MRDTNFINTVIGVTAAFAVVKGSQALSTSMANTAQAIPFVGDELSYSLRTRGEVVLPLTAAVVSLFFTTGHLRTGILAGLTVSLLVCRPQLQSARTANTMKPGAFVKGGTNLLNRLRGQPVEGWNQLSLERGHFG